MSPDEDSAATPKCTLAHVPLVGGLAHALGGSRWSIADAVVGALDDMGAAVAAWPAVALVGSYELLMMTIRGAQGTVTPPVPDADPLQAQAAQTFADDLESNRVPSVRTIRTRLHIGQPRAQRVQAYLATITSR